MRTLFLDRTRARTDHHLVQFALLLLSAAAIALVDLGHNDQQRFWGNVLGLTAQPFWLLSSWQHRQWGIFALAFFYAGVWTAGALRYL